LRGIRGVPGKIPARPGRFVAITLTLEYAKTQRGGRTLGAPQGSGPDNIEAQGSAFRLNEL